MTKYPDETVTEELSLFTAGGIILAAWETVRGF